MQDHTCEQQETEFTASKAHCLTRERSNKFLCSPSIHADGNFCREMNAKDILDLRETFPSNLDHSQHCPVIEHVIIQFRSSIPLLESWAQVFLSRIMELMKFFTAGPSGYKTILRTQVKDHHFVDE